MTDERASPFGTLESAYEFVSLLRKSAEEEYASILDEIALAQATPHAGRRVDALRLVNHKLDGLRLHLVASLLLINDLRMLKRLLVGDSVDGDDGSVPP